MEASSSAPRGESRPLEREALRGAVGYVGHAALVYGELTARENLAFTARLYGVSSSAERLDAQLERLGLGDWAHRRAGTLSRGLLQRLAIARALVHEPAVLLLDEPFTGLDEVSAGRLVETLQGLRSSGRTVIVVTHDPGRAVALSTRALLLERGRIVATAGGDLPGAAEAVPFRVDALRERLAQPVAPAEAG